MGRIANKLVEFIAIIYPEDLDKQDALMNAILEQSHDNPRLTEFTPKAFREIYEQTGKVSLDLKDMCAIIDNSVKSFLLNFCATTNVLIDSIDEIENPRWNLLKKCHEWKNHVGDSVIEIWDTFTLDQKLAIAVDAQERANREDWE